MENSLGPTILFENEDVLVVNKPAGLMVHAAAARKDAVTLVDWILKERPEIAGVGEPMNIEHEGGVIVVDRPGIVHRLDEETSGALIIAKNQESFLFLKEQFQDRTVAKEYHAFVWGHFKEDQGVVDAPIGRSKNDFRRYQAGRGVRGEEREAVTQWKAAVQFEDEKGEKFSFVHLFPKTGRTHQLRVHMNYLQRPIVSDHLYGPKKPDVLGFSRVALHAFAVSFQDKNGAIIRIEAPYQRDFQEAIEKYLRSDV